jgi:hypothetical protein
MGARSGAPRGRLSSANIRVACWRFYFELGVFALERPERP